MQINTVKAVDNPEAVFGSPHEVETHVGLTRGQKIAAVERWIFNVQARLDAVSEGMTSRPDGADAIDCELLRDLGKLLEYLRAQSAD